MIRIFATFLPTWFKTRHRTGEAPSGFRLSLWALGAILAASGACALIYEMLWTRLLTLILGSSAVAVSAVLVGFMGGLAAGSWWAGRYLDRHRGRGLRLYAWLEAIIGLYALASPFLLSGVQSLYVWLFQAFGSQVALIAALRFLLSALLLLIPTAMMGATLPAAVEYVLPQLKRVGVKVSFLYGLNTLGGMLGAFATGFLLIPALGVSATLIMTAGLNFLIALTAGLAARPSPAAPPVSAEDIPDKLPAAGPRAFFLIAAAAVGFCSLACEVIWMRILHLTFGSSVYAFSTLLTAFLAGMGIGSLVMARWLDRHQGSIRLLAGLELFVALVGLLLVPAFGSLPLLFVPLYQFFYRSFDSFQFIIFGASFLVLLGPATLMGAAFPLLAELHIKRTGRPGRGLGSIYAMNTAGSILGSLAATFILVPGLGSRLSLLAVTALNGGVGAWALLAYGKGRPLRRWAPVTVLILLFIGVGLFLPWNPLVQTAGAYTTNFVHALKRQKLNDILSGTKLLFYREGVSATVSVHRASNSNLMSLRVNGKTDASTAGDQLTQFFVGFLPFLWQKQADQVLVIGLGSGMTLSAALQAGAGSVDCVELEPEVVEAAGYFGEFNNHCLQDPRLRLIVDDGRNYLLANPKLYDMIISEPSNPWITGISNLFTLDHYRIAYQRLKPGGLMVQWFHVYSMSPRDVKIALATFRQVFPQAHLWWIPPTGDLILLTRKGLPLRYDYRIFQERLAKARGMKADLERIGLKTTGDIFACFAMGENRLQEFTAKVPINTDDRPYIEFSAPKYLYRPDMLAANKEIVMQHLDAIFPWIDRFEVEPAHRYQLETELAEAYLTQHSYAALQDTALRLLHDFPKEAAGYYYQGAYQANAGKLEAAEASFNQALRLKRVFRRAHFSLGLLYEKQQANQKAREHYETEIRANPGFWPAYFQLAMTHARSRQYAEAVGCLDRAVALGGRTAQVYYYRGVMHYFLQDLGAAQADLGEALKLKPEDENIHSLAREIAEELEDEAGPAPDRKRSSGAPKKAGSTGQDADRD